MSMQLRAQENLRHLMRKACGIIATYIASDSDGRVGDRLKKE